MYFACLTCWRKKNKITITPPPKQNTLCLWRITCHLQATHKMMSTPLEKEEERGTMNDIFVKAEGYSILLIDKNTFLVPHDHKTAKLVIRDGSYNVIITNGGLTINDRKQAGVRYDPKNYILAQGDNYIEDVTGKVIYTFANGNGSRATLIDE